MLDLLIKELETTEEELIKILNVYEEEKLNGTTK